MKDGGKCESITIAFGSRGLSSSGHGGDEYQLGHWWIHAGPAGEAYPRGALAYR
jgi:hypothetical protein